MAIEVRIPTILRTHTGGNKTVEGSGATLGALVDDLDTQHPGLKNRLVTEEGKLHRFVRPRAPMTRAGTGKTSTPRATSSLTTTSRNVSDEGPPAPHPS